VNKTVLESFRASYERKYQFRSSGGSAHSFTEQKAQHKHIRCHYCRSMDKDKSYIICTNYPDCLCGFCYDCLRETFGIQFKRIKKNWVCLVCHKKCNCRRCQEKLTNQELTPKVDSIAIETNNPPINHNEKIKTTKRKPKNINNYTASEIVMKKQKLQDSSEKIIKPIEDRNKELTNNEPVRKRRGKPKSETLKVQTKKSDNIVRIVLTPQTRSYLQPTPPSQEALKEEKELEVKEESPCVVTTGLALVSFSAEDYKQRFKVI